MWRSVALGFVLAGMLAGCSQGGPGAQSCGGTQDCGRNTAAVSGWTAYPPSGTAVAAVTKISGGSPAQRVLLRRVVDSMGPTAIGRITIKRPDPSWHPYQSGDVMLVVETLGSPNPRQENLLTEWQGWVVAAAFRDRSASAGLPRVIALDQRVGGHFGGGMRISDVHQGVEGNATKAQAAVLAAQLRTIIRQSGARLVRLSVTRPDGLAASVMVQTDRPAWYLHHRMPAVLRQTLNRFHYDGLAWAIYDQTGRRVFQMANASRLATGAEGTIPSLTGCNPFGPGDADQTNPPPKCPA
jgi:hypothetical protein